MVYKLPISALAEEARQTLLSNLEVGEVVTVGDTEPAAVSLTHENGVTYLNFSIPKGKDGEGGSGEGGEGNSSPAWESIDYLMSPTDLKGEAHLGKDTRGVVMQLTIDPTDGQSPDANPFLAPLPPYATSVTSLSGIYESKDFSVDMFGMSLSFLIQTFTSMGNDVKVFTRLVSQESPVEPPTYSPWFIIGDNPSYLDNYFSAILPYLRFMAFASKDGSRFYGSPNYVVSDLSNSISVISLESPDVPSGSKVTIPAYTSTIIFDWPDIFNLDLSIAHTISGGGSMSFHQTVGSSYLKIYLFQPEVPTEPLYVNLLGNADLRQLRYNPAFQKWEVQIDGTWYEHLTSSMPPITKGISCLTFSLTCPVLLQNRNLYGADLSVGYSNSLWSSNYSVIQNLLPSQWSRVGEFLTGDVGVTEITCDIPILGLICYSDPRGAVSNKIYPTANPINRYKYDRLLISELVGLNLTWDLDDVPVTIEPLSYFIPTAE